MEVPCTPDRLQNFLQESQKQHKPRREPVKDELGPRDSQTQVQHSNLFGAWLPPLETFGSKSEHKITSASPLDMVESTSECKIMSLWHVMKKSLRSGSSFNSDSITRLKMSLIAVTPS